MKLKHFLTLLSISLLSGSCTLSSEKQKSSSATNDSIVNKYEDSLLKDKRQKIDSTRGLTYLRGKVYPHQDYYQTLLLLKHINSNLEYGSEEILATGCGGFDTLSLQRKIYMLTFCGGGSYTETWVYMLNAQGKFISQFYGFIGIKLESKTNGVHDFLIHEHHSNTGAIMSFNKDKFDTLKIVNDCVKGKYQYSWNCWRN
jgi:predicted nucleic-acid-binding Zn-ribbon protein